MQNTGLASSSLMLGTMAPVFCLFLVVVHLYWTYTGCILKQILEAGTMPKTLGEHTALVEDASSVPSTDFGCFIPTYNSSSRETPCLWPLKASELIQGNQSINGMAKLSCPQPQHEALDKCLGWWHPYDAFWKLISYKCDLGYAPTPRKMELVPFSKKERQEFFSFSTQGCIKKVLMCNVRIKGLHPNPAISNTDFELPSLQI